MDVPSLGRNENNDAEHLIKRKVLMTALRYTVKFKKTLLASLIGLSVSQYTFALQEISDAGLSEATGEGIALLPENVSLQLNGTDNTAGAGYLRLIPVGPLTTPSQDTNKDGNVTAADHSVGKADIYLYGLALSQSNKNYGQNRTIGGAASDTAARFGRAIDSWGSAANPWLFKVGTEQNVPNFSASFPTDTGQGDVSYIGLEAPLYSANIANLTDIEKSAYNLKLGLWTDIFVRDPSKIEGDPAQFYLGQNFGGASDSDRANRLRLQAAWDGFSMNGTNLKMFQTLDGVKAGELTQGLSTTYNNTFGMAGVVRLNGGDAKNLRASYTNPNNTSELITSGANAIRTETAWVVSNTATYGCGDNSQGFSTTACEYRFRSKNVQDSLASGGSTWKAPAATSVMRLSTRETSNTDTLRTPAIDGNSHMPTFDVNEGIYLYNPNINLVLGSLYQPLTFGTDGKNITIELARIPNKASIYKQIYTNYAGTGADSSYKGSTCNIYQCGNNGLPGYQGNNATHSSISIGSTEYNAATNSLTAHKGLGAIGISFGVLKDRTVAAGYGTKIYTHWQDQQRKANIRYFNWSDKYEVLNTFWSDAAGIYDPYTGAEDCSTGFIGGACNRTAQNNGSAQTLGSKNIFVAKGSHYDWVYRTSGDTDSAVYFTPATDAQNTANGAYTNAQIAAGNDVDTTKRDYANRAAQASNVSWTTRTAATANKPNWADSTTSSALVRGVTLSTIPTIATINTSATNNFGSAVIDGMLIQHMKFTTKGL